MSRRPLLVIRAQVDPAVYREFEQWYQKTHLPSVLKIPGIIGGYRCWSARGYPNFFALHKFQDESVLEQALSSPEALHVREGWTRWMPFIREMSVEVYSPLVPALSIFYTN